MSRILRRDQLGEVAPWRTPDVDDGPPAVAAVREDRTARLPTAEEIERLQAQAYEEARAQGLAQGRAEGLAQGREEVERRVALLQGCLEHLARPFQDLDAQVEEELAALAVAVARQVIRRELRTDPGDVVAVVKEALAALPAAVRQVVVHLHPEDAALVEELLGGGERSWRIEPDATLSRGDCRVDTDSARIDATVETRLAAVAAQLLGGERAQDRD